MSSKVFEVAFKLGAELTSSFKSAFNQANGTMKMLGGAVAALGGTAALTSVVSQVADMSDSLAQVSAQTGIVGQDFEELKSVATNLFRNNYGEDFNEVTAALANIKQNMHELNDVDLEQFAGDALMFTKTFDADINELTRAANNMMSSFGVESSKAMDLFAAGAQRGLNFSDEMLDNVAEYAPLFGAMGYSAEEYFGILERGAQAGVYNLDYVNDAMKEFQIRTKDGSKATSEAMGSLSKETQNVWESFLNGNGTVSEVASTVVSELKGMEDQVAANQIAVSLFGTKWEDLEADAMYAMLGTQDAMQGFEGAMEQINEIQFDTFNSAIRGIGRILLMDLVYPIGEAVLPYLNQFANYLSSNLPGAIERAKSVLVSVGPTILGIAGAFVAYRASMATVTAATTAFNAVKKASTALLYAHRTAMLASTFAGGGLRGVIAGLRSGMAALNVTMLANPFVLAAVAIAALAAGFVLLYQKSETFRTAVAPLVEMVKTEFSAMGSQIGAAFQSIIPVLTSFASSIIPVITDIATMVIPLLLQAVQLVFPAILSIVSAVLPIVFSLLSTVVNVVLTLAQTVLPILLTIVSTVFPIILSVIQMAVPIISMILQTLVTIIQNVLLPAINSILAVVQFVFGYVQVIIQNAMTLVNGIIQAAMALLQGNWSGAWSIIQTTASTIMNNIISFFSGINLFEVGKAIIDGLINGIKSMGSAVIGAISGMIPEPIKGAASKLLGALPGFAEGGIVSSPTLAWIGEGGDTETVIPWNNSQRSKDLWMQTGQQLGMLNNQGILSEVQQAQVNVQPTNSIINPIQQQQVLGNNSGGSVIHVQYSPSYSVTNSQDLERVKEHAAEDQNDLMAKLAEIQRNEKRLAFS